MTVTKKKVNTPTAREKLRPSVLRETQLELMGEDVDLTKLYLKLNHKAVGFNIVEAVTDVNIHRTIEGASTVDVTVEDRDRTLLNSGLLSSRNDIEIDGLYFRLVSVRKDGPELTLSFEDREVSLLRLYNKPIKQSLKTARTRVTRAEFVLRMIKEVKETKIRYVIPELHKQQPIDSGTKQPPTQFNQNQRGFGIPKWSNVTVKGERMKEFQRKNANDVLNAGIPRVRKMLVCAIMCAIQESSITNLGQPKFGAYNYLSALPERNPVGVFQQIKYYGWPATRDVTTDATAFYDKLGKIFAQWPNMSYSDAVESVQHSGDASKYAQWRIEAERIVTAYGYPPYGKSAPANSQWQANVGTTVYEFYRGLPPTSKINKQKYDGRWGPENSWDCMYRLANEVQWRRFFVSGVFYFISEDDLFKSQPIATIDEDSDGIDAIDGDYDEGKKTATLTVKCQMGRWAAPPGSVIQIRNMGPWNGRWLVNDVERSAFDPNGTITLKKPLPRLPEPSASNLIKDTQNQGTWHLAPQPPKKDKQYEVASGIVQPVPAGFNNKLVQGIHSTVGLSGQSFSYFTGTWPSNDAADFGASAGAPVIAPESGKIVHLSGHQPSAGPTSALLGAHGPFGLSIYLLGNSGAYYFLTHLGSRNVKIGENVLGGQQIGTVGDYAKFGGVNHCHCGVFPPKSGHPNIKDLMAALLAQGSSVTV